MQLATAAALSNGPATLRLQALQVWPRTAGLTGCGARRAEQEIALRSSDARRAELGIAGDPRA